MSIEEQMEEIEKISLEEINLRIIELEKKIGDDARTAMNDIYWIIKTPDLSKNVVKNVEEIVENFRNKDVEGIRLYIQKTRKEQYLRSPEEFRKNLVHIQELSEKFRREDEENNK